MRDYSKLYTRFWTRPDICNLASEQKLMAAYVLSSTHTTMLGCFRLPLAYAVDDLNMGFETVQEGFRKAGPSGPL